MCHQQNKCNRDDFLQAEERCECAISSETKKLWKTQMDMLEAVVAICERHGLRYSLYAGSMLGLARHAGYIPWDDDLDLAMLREDYDKFLKYAMAELPAPLSLQCALTTPELPMAFAKIRNGNTAAIDKYRVSQHSTVNQGIFIDIFPLDYIYSDAGKRSGVFRKYVKMHTILKQTVRPRFEAKKGYIQYFKDLSRHLMSKLRVALSGGYLSFYEKTQDVFRKLPKEECDSVLDCTFCAFCAPNAKVYRKEWFDTTEYVEMPYEYLMLKVPKEYDNILKEKYGDWHKMVRGGAFHEVLEYSTERGYKEILIEKYGYSIEEFKS